MICMCRLDHATDLKGMFLFFEFGIHTSIHDIRCFAFPMNIDLKHTNRRIKICQTTKSYHIIILYAHVCTYLLQSFCSIMQFAVVFHGLLAPCVGPVGPLADHWLDWWCAHGGIEAHLWWFYKESSSRSSDARSKSSCYCMLLFLLFL